MNTQTMQALFEVGAEIDCATEKHPTAEHRLAALVEEVGELAQTLLQCGNGARSRVEASHVACVAVRIMTDGDADFAVADSAGDATMHSKNRPAASAQTKPTKPRRAAKAKAKAKVQPPAGGAMKCQQCGVAFPAGTAPQKKYCDACVYARKKACPSMQKRVAKPAVQPVGLPWQRPPPSAAPLAADPPGALTPDAKAARLAKIKELARLRTECTMCGQKSSQLRAGVCPDCDGRADEDGRAP